MVAGGEREDFSSPKVGEEDVEEVEEVEEERERMRVSGENIIADGVLSVSRKSSCALC